MALLLCTRIRSRPGIHIPIPSSKPFLPLFAADFRRNEHQCGLALLAYSFGTDSLCLHDGSTLSSVRGHPDTRSSLSLIFRGIFCPFMNPETFIILKIAVPVQRLLCIPFRGCMHVYQESYALHSAQPCKPALSQL